MSTKRLTRAAGAMLALVGTAAVLTGGIALAQGEHHNPKSPPPGSAPASVNGHTVRVTPTGPTSSGAGAAKKSPPPGSGSVSVSGNTVHVSPQRASSRGSL
jgi:hypothetical protein